MGGGARAVMFPCQQGAESHKLKCREFVLIMIEPFFLSVVFVMHLCGYHRKTTLCLKSRWLCSGKYLNIRVFPRNLAASMASSRHVVHAPLSAGTPQRQTRCPRRPLPGSRNRRTQGARPPLSSPSVSEVCLEPLSPEGSMHHNHSNLHLTSRQG